tara:strand:- start:334 stop:597 length:264 start_codon:yes stop_codon:yes gene_type:complete
MRKYLNQTTVNVIAIGSAIAFGTSLVLDGVNLQLKKQVLMNRQLDYDIARLKNCGELKRFGIMFHPESPMSYLCADVLVTYPDGPDN